MKTLLLAITAMPLTLIGPAGAQAPQADAPHTETMAELIQTRQAGYDLMIALMGAINNGLKANVDVKTYAGGARAVGNWARQIPLIYPPGSDVGRKNRALPVIWTDRAKFEQTAADLATQADKLGELARAGDTAGFTEQFKVTAAVCDTCHATFRAK